MFAGSSNADNDYLLLGLPLPIRASSSSPFSFLFSFRSFLPPILPFFRPFFHSLLFGQGSDFFVIFSFFHFYPFFGFAHPRCSFSYTCQYFASVTNTHASWIKCSLGIALNPLAKTRYRVYIAFSFESHLSHQCIVILTCRSMIIHFGCTRTHK